MSVPAHLPVSLSLSVPIYLYVYMFKYDLRRFYQPATMCSLQTGFSRISQALRQYAADKNTHRLINVAAEVLYPRRYSPLCDKFKNHIPEEHRNAFQNLLSKLRAAASPGAPLPSPLPAPGLLTRAIEAASHNHGSRSQKAVTRQPGTDTKTTSLLGCPFCGAVPPVAPYTSSCCCTSGKGGGAPVACYSCWLRCIALKQCLACKRPIKKTMLSKVYFPPP